MNSLTILILILAFKIPLSSNQTPAPLLGWPVGGQMTQSFGCSVHNSGVSGPDCPTDTPWFHDGVDIAAPVGRSVRAAMSGTVIFAGPDGRGPQCGTYRGYGLGVVVDNGRGWQTLYAHLDQITVQTGQQVDPQTIVGTVGESGCSTGPHLHFGLRQRGVLVNPQRYIRSDV